MDNTFLEGGIENLEKVKEKLREESGKQEAFNAAEAELKAKQKDLENQKKYMTDKIATATKERRAELKKQHDEHSKNDNSFQSFTSSLNRRYKL